jgi:signal transduction histidine kinase
MINTKILKIRPYARLLTMLGEQLIKNERIALIELIKNSYDADANWVKVSFLNFGENYEITSESKIIIEDDGIGMNAEIIEKHWLNPATPDKKIRKQKNDKTPKGRVIQGEKGIGRFAVLKLGKKIKITTRRENENIENIVEYDFSRYDDEFLTENGNAKELYLDDLNISFYQQHPQKIVERKMILGLNEIERLPQGTIIEISEIKGSWSESKIRSIFRDLNRFESIFNNLPNMKVNKEFEVFIYKDEVQKNYHENYIKQLHFLLNEKAVFKIENGYFDSDKLEYRFEINGEKKVLGLLDTELTGNQIFRQHFGKNGEVLRSRKIECGSFNFGFYVFDFSSNALEKYKLDSEDKKIIRDHRIYLYRDGIRVYPYGEPEDDWLHIDADRGTKSAGSFLSNDQVVGYVNITQKGNPNLQDKTNREGLIEQGNATADFIALLRIFLSYVRSKPYARYRHNIEKKERGNIFKKQVVQKRFDELKETIKNNQHLHTMVVKLEKAYEKERDYLVRRAEITEELAGVGLSVETASHDIMAAMGKATSILNSIISDIFSISNVDIETLQKELQALLGLLSFIESQLKDIQLLFRSTKQKRREIRVKEIIEKIFKIYKRILSQEKINFEIKEFGSPLIAKTTDAVLLQLFLNLFDNSVYWLQQVLRDEKKIVITLDGDQGKLIFSDNGPGIKKEDEPYIFEPFYSGKGEEGRGLGLYIAKQLLERNDYSIELAELSSDKILQGANFVVYFISKEG